MSLKLKKEELELLSNKDIAELILENSKKTINTADLFKKIIKLLELPESTFENKIADYYTALSTDKRFILLDSGNWGLRKNYKVGSLIKEEDIDDEDIEEDNYDDNEDEDYNEDTNEELKDLVVIDEDELELEE